MENVIYLPPKKKNNKKFLFYLYLFVMLAGMFIRNALEISFPVQALLALTIIPILFGDENDILAVGVACIPFSAGFQYKYALLLCVMVYMIKKKGLIKLNTVLIPIIIMFIWEFLHFLSGFFSIIEHIRNFAELIFFAVVLCMDLKNVNYKQVFRSLAISTVGVCVIVFYMQLAGHGFNLHDVIDQSYDSYRFGMNGEAGELFRLNFNPNALGLVCNLSVFSMLILISQQKANALDVILLISSVVFGFMTLSRSYVICLCFIIAYYAIVSGQSAKQKAINLFSLIIIGILICWICYQAFPEVFKHLMDRFSESNVLNGRDSLFVFYNRHILSSPSHLLFGVGLQDLFAKIFQIHGRLINVPHNGYQELIVVWGLLGLVLFFWLLFAMIRRADRTVRNKTFLANGPISLLLLYSLSGQLITSGIVLLALSFCYVTLHISKEQVIKKKKTRLPFNEISPELLHEEQKTYEEK